MNPLRGSLFRLWRRRSRPSLLFDINYNNHLYEWNGDTYVKVAELEKFHEVYLREEGQVLQLRYGEKYMEIKLWDQVSKKLTTVYKKKNEKKNEYELSVTKAKDGKYHIVVAPVKVLKTIFLSYDPNKKICVLINADYTFYLHSLGLETFIESSSRSGEQKSFEIWRFNEKEGVYLISKEIKTPLPLFTIKTEDNFVYISDGKEAYQVLLDQNGNVEFLKIPLPPTEGGYYLLDGKNFLTHYGDVYERKSSKWEIIQKLNSKASYHGKDEIILSEFGKRVTILFWHLNKFISVTSMKSKDFEKLEDFEILKPSSEQRQKRLKQLNKIINLPNVLLLEVVDFCIW